MVQGCAVSGCWGVPNLFRNPFPPQKKSRRKGNSHWDSPLEGPKDCSHSLPRLPDPHPPQRANGLCHRLEHRGPLLSRPAGKDSKAVKGGVIQRGWKNRCPMILHSHRHSPHCPPNFRPVRKPALRSPRASPKRVEVPRLSIFSCWSKTQEHPQ